MQKWQSEMLSISLWGGRKEKKINSLLTSLNQESTAFLQLQMNRELSVALSRL